MPSWKSSLIVLLWKKYMNFEQYQCDRSRSNNFEITLLIFHELLTVYIQVFITELETIVFVLS